MKPTTMSNPQKIVVCRGPLSQNLETLHGWEKTKVFTDKISLCYLDTKMQTTPREVRWYDTIILMEVHVRIIKNIKDKTMLNALK